MCRDLASFCLLMYLWLVLSPANSQKSWASCSVSRRRWNDRNSSARSCCGKRHGGFLLNNGRAPSGEDILNLIRVEFRYPQDRLRRVKKPFVRLKRAESVGLVGPIRQVIPPCWITAAFYVPQRFNFVASVRIIKQYSMKFAAFALRSSTETVLLFRSVTIILGLCRCMRSDLSKKCSGKEPMHMTHYSIDKGYIRI